MWAMLSWLVSSMRQVTIHKDVTCMNPARMNKRKLEDVSSAVVDHTLVYLAQSSYDAQTSKALTDGSIQRFLLQGSPPLLSTMSKERTVIQED
jgi:hypothetical protein